MATKKKTTKTTKRRSSSSGGAKSLVNALAFWGLLFAAVVFLINAILHWTGVVLPFAGLLNMLATIALIASVFLAAWDYVKGKGKSWRTAFIFIVVVALIFLILPTFIA
ncbi:MAG: hypothetical protein LBN25_02295 [Christensenellaceae bacterium]|jgi:hypothetical protein|nr:hypothetical protein [Christensenellaceae bacterium]